MPESGQLLSISGTINQTTESAAYTYDDLGRIVTSNQTSNGSSAQRRFAYDRWGSRTGVWDAASGGNQIQSVVLQQSGGAPTNHLVSVTNGSTVFNYSYDAVGNVVNDGSHSYTYDAENRLVSVDSGATAQYGYDFQNQRVKKTCAGTTLHYVWQDSHVIAEYNGGSGALQAEYIYSGNKMVAKVVSGSTSYFLSDPLGARSTLDGSGNVAGKQGRLPFGEDFAETGTQEKHHFTTYERDAETGLDYAVNRMYSPNTGRFEQTDPYTPKRECDSNNPQKLGRYRYVENDPLNKVDPLGLWSHWQFLCTIAPILCGGVLGGPPLPSPDGYSGWNLGFGWGGDGGCACDGTTDCKFYKEKCKQAADKPYAIYGYYCVLAPAVCRLTKDDCINNCRRLQIQELDEAALCINSPINETFETCQLEVHVRAFALCKSFCGN